MKAGFTLLVCGTLALAGQAHGGAVIDPTFLWTGASEESTSVLDAANWDENPATPAGDGTETLVFGEIGTTDDQNVFIPVSASFKNLSFTGDDRPIYNFEGLSGTKLILTGNVSATLGGHNRSVTLGSSLELSLTAGSHTVEAENIINVFAKITDHDGMAGILKRGAGTLYLSGENTASTFSGGIIVEQGTLLLSGSSSLIDNHIVSGPIGTGALTIQDGATVSAFLGDVEIANAVVLTAGTATLSGVSDFDSLHLSGPISGPGHLRIAGDGIFRLSGPNTYSAGTTVNSGTLVVGAGTGNALGSGHVNVHSGAVLRLDNASISNTVTFNQGSLLTGDGYIHNATIGYGVTISPGSLGAASIGTITFQDLTLEGGGTLEWTLQNATQPPGTGWDLINVQSATTLTIASNAGNPFNLKLFSSDGEGTGQALPFGFDPNQQASWLIFSTNGIAFTGGGSLADSFAIDAHNFGGVSNNLFSLTQAQNEIFLTFTPVPEPSTYALIASGLAALGYRAWRRRNNGRE